MEMINLRIILLTFNVVFTKNIKVIDYDLQLIIKEMFLDYNPMLRPNYLGAATDVDVDATILAITNLDEVNMMYTLDMFFRQRWHDYRLAHNLSEKLTIIMGTKDPSDIIWVPDTVFIDSVTSNMHHVTVNNHNLNINPDGSVFWGTRVTVSPSCPLNLKSYPMDKQICKFEIVSYAYTSRHVRYRWLKNDSLLIKSQKMAQFALDEYKTSSEEIKYVAGSYWVLTGHFHFRRLIGPAVLQIFVPTICVVIVSWISLWVKRSVVPARAALLITTLLTISAVWSSINSQLPRVNYVKAIDIFMMTSFGSIITSLIEFTVVLNTDAILKVVNRYRGRQNIPEERKENEKFLHEGNNDAQVYEMKVADTGYKHIDQFKCMRDDTTFLPAINKRTISEDMDSEINAEESEKLANSIENTARVCFPIVYVLFLFIYFPYYLYEGPARLTKNA